MLAPVGELPARARFEIDRRRHATAGRSAASVKPTAAQSASPWMSTDNRGRSRRNKLMAVPPFSAKSGSSATKGRTSTRSATWAA